MNRRWQSLHGRLLLAHLLVIAVALATAFLAAQLSAPTFFARNMMDPDNTGRMGGLMRSMMGAPGSGGAMAALEEIIGSAFRRSLAEALVVAALAAALVAAGVSVFVSARISTPIRRLATASRRIAAGHYAERVPAEELDELGELASSFNEMATTLEATERRRLELVGDVAHELRTPIATLEGYLEGLLDGVVDASPRTWAKLHDEAGRLRRLVDDLQELSRAEARQIPLSPRPVAPTDIADAALERLAGEFADKGLTLLTDRPDGLPAVRADRDRAIQVLTNLLTNALRYTPAPGSVRLALRPVGDAVEFAVADSGMGLTSESMLHVFERFYRVDKSRSRAFGGSGVGLTIARALVEAMGGTIWVRSDGPGRGATFGFTLPTAR